MQAINLLGQALEFSIGVFFFIFRQNYCTVDCQNYILFVVSRPLLVGLSLSSEGFSLGKSNLYLVSSFSFDLRHAIRGGVLGVKSRCNYNNVNLCQTSQNCSRELKTRQWRIRPLAPRQITPFQTLCHLLAL